MPQSVPARSYVSSLLLFDPLALPDDYDTTDEPQIEIVGAADADDKVVWIDAPATRTHHLLAFVDEPVSEHLESLLVVQRDLKKFRVTSDAVIFSGAEFAYRNDDSGITESPGRGGRIKITPGNWNVTLFGLKNVDAVIDEKFRQKTTKLQFRFFQINSWLMAAAGIVVFMAFVCVFISPFIAWLTTWLPAMVILVALAIATRFNSAYRTARHTLDGLRDLYPDFVAVFSRY